MAEREDNMKESKRQTMLMVGFALIVIAGIMIYISLSSPRVYSSKPAGSTVATSNIAAADPTTKTYVDEGPQVVYPLNLNTTTVEELMTIDGVGEKRASDIIAYRESKGGYKAVSEIKNIKGIGDSLYQQISPYLTV